MSEPIVGYESRIEYILNGSQIIGETMSDTFNVSAGFTEQYTLVYIYDEMGAPIGIKHRTPSYAAEEFDYYFFEKSLQGDIIAIYDETGSKIGTYTYDAWGNCTTTSNSGYNFILYNNPFRYRGYYYDTETGYYYLQSRYYNPTWGRFINADEYINANGDIIGYNMFAYCSNNPVMFADPSGCSTEWWQWALFGVGVALVATAAVMAAVGTGGVAAFGTGALIGSLSVGTIGAGVGAAIGYATDGKDGILGGALAGFGLGAMVGFAVGGRIQWRK